MYKVLFVSDQNVSLLENMLNEAAQSGYRWVHAFSSIGRTVMILEQGEVPVEKRRPGRPPKKVEEEENGLGK